MLLNQEPGYEKVQDLLNEAQNDLRDVLMSGINVGETYYIICRKRGESIAEQFLTVLPSTRITIVVPTFEDILAAAKIKARYPISYADAFVVATAIKKDIPVVTGDPEFQRVEETII